MRQRQILQRLNQGLSSDGHPLPRVKVSVNSSHDGKSKLRFAVKGTHPGLIAYLCERVGLRYVHEAHPHWPRAALWLCPSGMALPAAARAVLESAKEIV